MPNRARRDREKRARQVKLALAKQVESAGPHHDITTRPRSYVDLADNAAEAVRKAQAFLDAGGTGGHSQGARVLSRSDCLMIRRAVNGRWATPPDMMRVNVMSLLTSLESENRVLAALAADTLVTMQEHAVFDEVVK
jgi:hypothetical protein